MKEVCLWAGVHERLTLNSEPISSGSSSTSLIIRRYYSCANREKLEASALLAYPSTIFRRPSSTTCLDTSFSPHSIRAPSTLICTPICTNALLACSPSPASLAYAFKKCSNTNVAVSRHTSRLNLLSIWISAQNCPISIPSSPALVTSQSRI